MHDFRPGPQIQPQVAKPNDRASGKSSKSRPSRKSSSTKQEKKGRSDSSKEIRETAKKIKSDGPEIEKKVDSEVKKLLSRPIEKDVKSKTIDKIIKDDSDSEDDSTDLFSTLFKFEGRPSLVSIAEQEVERNKVPSLVKKSLKNAKKEIETAEKLAQGGISDDDEVVDQLLRSQADQDIIKALARQLKGDYKKQDAESFADKIVESGADIDLIQQLVTKIKAEQGTADDDNIDSVIEKGAEIKVKKDIVVNNLLLKSS